MQVSGAQVSERLKSMSDFELVDDGDFENGDGSGPGQGPGQGQGQAATDADAGSGNGSASTIGGGDGMTGAVNDRTINMVQSDSDHKDITTTSVPSSLFPPPTTTTSNPPPVAEGGLFALHPPSQRSDTTLPGTPSPKSPSGEHSAVKLVKAATVAGDFSFFFSSLSFYLFVCLAVIQPLLIILIQSALNPSFPLIPYI